MRDDGKILQTNAEKAAQGCAAERERKMSLTASDLARLGPAAQKQVVEKVLAQKTGKYHNRKTVRHGITFDSKHEADRYDELRLLLKAGEIHDLKLQQTYKLVGVQRTPTGAAVRAHI